MSDEPLALDLAELGRDDVARVGGKNASLGEMIRHLAGAGVRVPGGFATTARAYRLFLAENALEDRIRSLIDRFHREEASLEETGAAIREAILAGEMPSPVAEAVRGAYLALAERLRREDPDVAVRSSATAEDLPEASFAGQQETFLNIRGAEALLEACRRCYASLFTDRAIVYRENNGFDHLKVALSVGVQQMVRADTGAAGVMFSIDTETGFPDAVLINAAWGLGETVVQGSVDPDQVVVFKPLLDQEDLTPVIDRQRGGKERKMVYAEGGETELTDTTEEERIAFVLSDAESVALARWAALIERHYDRPMDLEWARDGESGELYILQARPETVQARREAGALKSYRIHHKGKELARGYSVGDAIAAGPVRRLAGPDEIDRFEAGDVLVTGKTDPD